MNEKLSFDTYKEEAVAGRGVIVTNHPLASAAGIEMFARGGNAFDASVASLFALTVVEPMMVGIFGAGFFTLRSAKKEKIETIDNYAMAPKVAKEDMYTPVEGRRPGDYLFETVGRKNMVGYRSVATPGALKGWEHIVKEYGALGLSEVMEPAIRYARNGFRASPFLAFNVDKARGEIELYPETAKVYLPNGSPLKPWDLIRREEYAETLDEISRNGSAVLYGGRLGRAVSDDMNENEGILTLEDLKAYKLIFREPARGTYRDAYEIYSVAPVSSGGIHIIQMLNILERFDLASLGFGSTDHLHLVAESLKIAFADRQEFIGDPERTHVPWKGLTSKEYAEERGVEIDLDKAKNYTHGEPKLCEGSSMDTTHVSAMDFEGNIVAATQTLFSAFGSMVTVPGTGMLLNNCMGLFDPRPGRANSVAGGKRMLSSMSPTLVFNAGKPIMALGTPGGTRIFASICQAIINVIDFGMTLQQAVEAPRIWTMGIEGTDGEDLHIEPGLPEKTLNGLRRRGHVIVEMPKIAGGMNGILYEHETGLIHGGACWRADGAPMGFSGGWAHPKAMQPIPKV